MLFNSFEFAVFFPVVTLGYFLLPHRARWGWLLAASSVFYMAFVPAYILILVFLILVDYSAGLLIERARGARRKSWLVASIVANVGVLAFYKYFNFINGTIQSLAGWAHFSYPVSNLRILLPIGLSFHTFQSMSYTIEVYYGRQKAERHLGIYALYVMFYPQLVAGPIERPQNLLHQFRERHAPEYGRITSGLKLIFIGLFKKMLIADGLAPFVNGVYDRPGAATGWELLLATYFFSIQIFCDFSGYSDIAIGSARVMGFDLMTNFAQPYLAASIPEFWRRWHISLSTWFRDYLYIPLGGNRGTRLLRYRNIMIVFLVSGLWHGANWTFVIWGFIHGVAMLVADASKGFFSGPATRVRRALGIFVTFHVTTFAWIFFRANSLADALYIVGHLWPVGSGGRASAIWTLIEPQELLIAVSLIALLLGLQLLEKRRPILERLKAYPTWFRWAVYYGGCAVFVFVTLQQGGSHKAQQFIYFQF